MVRVGIALVFLCSLQPACSSDAASEPEPELERPGAFVAVDTGEDALTLFRTLSALHLETGDTVLFTTVYDVEPSNWDEAREISKDHDIPILIPITSASRNVLVQSSYRVVWYRTLTKEEEDLAR